MSLFLADLDPYDTESDVAKDTNVYLRIGADGGDIVDLDTVLITIEGSDAYDGDGTPAGYQDGFYGTVTSDGSNGYIFDIDPESDFPETTTIDVDVYAENTLGTVILNQSYSFDITTYPFISALDPANGETGVDHDKNIEMTLDGGSGNITKSTIEVRVDSVLAYDDDGATPGFQPGFQGTGSSIVVNGNGYDLVIDQEEDFGAGQRIDLQIDADNDLSFSIDEDKYFKTNIYTTQINPVTPVGNEKLAPIEQSIYIDFTKTPVLIKVNSVVAWDGAFQNGWSGLNISHVDGTRIVLDPPSDFTINVGVVVEAQTTTDSRTWRFLPGTTQATTTHDTGSPVVLDADGSLWYAYTRDYEEGLTPPLQPGNIYMRKGNPLTAEAITVTGQVVDVGFDANTGLINVVFEHNRKVQFMTVLPTDSPSYKNPESILFTNANMSLYGDQRRQRGTIFYGSTYGNQRRGMTYDWGTPGLGEFLSTPYPVTLHCYNTVSSYMQEYVIGFEVYKSIPGSSYWRPLGTISYTYGDPYAVFVDNKFIAGASYRCRAIFQYDDTATSKIFKSVTSDIVTLSENTMSDLAAMSIYGGRKRQVVLSVTISPPLKRLIADYGDISVYGGRKRQVVPSSTSYVPVKRVYDTETMDMSVYGGTDRIVKLDITGYDPIGVG